jgi:retron-type reverse transcriptase
MREAWKRVRRNKGAPGVDGRTIHETAVLLREYWDEIKERLMDGTYRPQPVLRVEIPKPGGGVRKLGVPTVLDRTIQQAVQQILSPLFDPEFSETSIGVKTFAQKPCWDTPQNLSSHLVRSPLTEMPSGIPAQGKHRPRVRRGA